MGTLRGPGGNQVSNVVLRDANKLPWPRGFQIGITLDALLTFLKSGELSGQLRRLKGAGQAGPGDLRREICALLLHLSATASQAQHYSVSTLLNSTNSFSTLLDFNTSAFNTSCIQHYSYSTSTYSTRLAFNTSCIQHFLYSTLLDFNNHGFNTTCFQHPWFQQSLFSTILDFNNPCFQQSLI